MAAEGDLIIQPEVRGRDVTNDAPGRARLLPSHPLRVAQEDDIKSALKPVVFFV